MSAPVIAASGEPTCGARRHDKDGVSVCGRPENHAGGHLDATGSYWQALEVKS